MQFVFGLTLVLQISGKIRHFPRDEELRRRHSDSYYSQTITSSAKVVKVSKMLDKLLTTNYNNQLKPEGKDLICWNLFCWLTGSEGKVSEVKVNIAVTTLGPVQDDKELLLLTCYLRSVGQFGWVRWHNSSSRTTDNIGTITDWASTTSSIWIRPSCPSTGSSSTPFGSPTPT